MTAIHSLLKTMIEKQASDIHIRAGMAPAFRVNGELYRANMNPLMPQDIESMVSEITTEDQRAAFNKNLELDFALGLRDVGRFRINVFRQRGSMALAIRSIRLDTPTFAELSLPAVILDIAMKRRGLILVTGTTGSGKSSLLASMIDHINNNSSVNIVTVEDPIEFLYKNNKSIIAQRELGQDTLRFAQALRSSFRQDPDVILIGEIRDKDTIETALSAADTGHLVMSTFHTMNAIETISRIMSFFQPHQHQQIRLVLSSVLVAIISLRLLPRQDEKGRVPAAEIMINNATIAEYLLHPEKSHLIMDAICEGYTQYGSQSFDQSLLQLLKDELISFQVARQNASNPDDFELKVKGIEGTSDRRWIA
jgi:twitching motility protein PilT